MGEHKTRDQIDIELSRTYFGNTEDKPSSPIQEKAQQEKAQQEKVQYAPPRRRWSPLTFLFILWIISSIIFAAGYLLRGKRIVFNVNINVEPGIASRKQTKPPRIIQDLTAKLKRVSSSEKIQIVLPGVMHPSSETIRFSLPKTAQEFVARLKQDLPNKIHASRPEAAFIEIPKPKTKPKPPVTAPAARNVKTLYDFEVDEDGWEIPAWEVDKPDHVARSLKRTDAFANSGSGGLELIAEFSGGHWTAALIEVQQYLDLSNYDGIQADVFVPADCPEGLRARLILTVGGDWRFVEMSRSVRLVPGEWTTISANMLEGGSDWKRAKVDEAFRSDVRKIALRIESNRKPAYSGPIYIDNIRVSSSQ
ncbi:MAG: hypothetical protein WBB86_08700 [Candidatus Omnitrophota bacterium]